MTTNKSEKKRRVDWDAVERDYRTGKFTLRELEAKYGANNATISRRAKQEGWTQDLSKAIRQATNAALISEIVSAECSKTQQNAAATVLVAAEVNTRIILKHQRKLSELHDLAAFAKEKLEEVGGALVDVKDVATFVQAVGNLATTTKTLIEQERKAFRLDDEGQQADSYEDILRKISEDY